MTRYIVFTDLDGTLIDHDTYDFRAALPGLSMLKKAKIPVVFCSSKTRREQEVLRKALGITDPFIVEDGSAVYVDGGSLASELSDARERDGYRILELGMPYASVRERLADACRRLHLSLRGYGDASTEEIASATGLPLEDARLAKMREYEETILTPLSTEDAFRLKSTLADYGVTLSRGGRFYSVKGMTSKGRAVMALTKRYGRKNGRLITVGIGDSANDVPFLSVVYIPILVQRPDRSWHPIKIRGVKKIQGVGPEGWTRAMTALVSGKLF